MLRSPCINCGQVIPKSVYLERESKRKKAIRDALQMAKSLGEPVGRPRSVDYAEILQLRSEGFSIAKIAEKLSTSQRTVSRGSVQHCLKTTKPKKNL